MIITQTPFRMSFFGGGTDFPQFYNEHGGAVISTTFDKYCYVTVRHLPAFFEYKTHLTYSKTEWVNSYEEIQHPAIREAMRSLDLHSIRLTYDADLPARSGLGTSSSFAVGMLNAFHQLKGIPADKRKLADDAINLERVLCGEAGGIQDQIATSFGGLNRIDFTAEGYTVKPLKISDERREELNGRLMMFFTGFSRNSFEIQKTTAPAIKNRTEELLEMMNITNEAEKVLTGGELDEFGRLLRETWALKRRMTDLISTSQIDDIYDRALAAGASGGKLLGAGGGGFLIFYVEPDKQPSVRKALGELLYVPFKFENEGTRVIHISDEHVSE